MTDVYRCWAYWEALRRLGFSANDIYVSVYHDTRLSMDVCGVELHAQGLSFRISAAELTRHPDEFLADWKNFGEHLPPDEVLQPLWDNRPSDVDDLASGLVLKGFELPLGLS